MWTFCSRFSCCQLYIYGTFSFYVLGLYSCVNHFFVDVLYRPFARYVGLVSTACARQLYHTAWLWWVFFLLLGSISILEKVYCLEEACSLIWCLVPLATVSPSRKVYARESCMRIERFCFLCTFKYLTVFSCKLAFLTFVLPLLRSWKVLLHRASCLCSTLVFVVLVRKKKKKKQALGGMPASKSQKFCPKLTALPHA